MLARGLIRALGIGLLVCGCSHSDAGVGAAAGAVFGTTCRACLTDQCISYGSTSNLVLCERSTSCAEALQRFVDCWDAAGRTAAAVTRCQGYVNVPLASYGDSVSQCMTDPNICAQSCLSGGGAAGAGGMGAGAGGSAGGAGGAGRALGE